jgi:hypothetical protein
MAGVMDHLQPRAAHRAQGQQRQQSAPPVRTAADEIRAKVSFARQSHPQIAATAADDFIARGLTPDQASEELYKMISNDPDVAADSIVSAFHNAKGTAPQRAPSPAAPLASAAPADSEAEIAASVVATYHKYAGASEHQAATAASEPQTEAEMAASVVASFRAATGGGRN